MSSFNYINNKLKRHFEDIQYLIKKQDKLLDEMNESIATKDDYVFNVETTVRNLNRTQPFKR